MFNLKKILCVTTIFMISLMSLVGCGQQAKETKNDSVTETDETTAVESNEKLLSGMHHGIIKVKDYGDITVELNADVAPVTVTNFVNLAKDGFYNNLTFMRVMENFMIQGGDPNKDCTEGSSKTIKGEFQENEIENSISHVRGTISMARSNDYDSASSQFFICNADATFLDGQYAAFGTVTEGMDVVDKITEKL